MKLSELSTDRAADVLCEITPFLANLAGDTALQDTLRDKLKLQDGQKPSMAELYTFGAQKLAVIVPIVLKDHRADVFGMLAALNGTTAAQIAAQGVMDTMGQLREVMQDGQLRDFFKSLQQEGNT
ncbi:MAG TPA: hypothetical protein H9790_09460 [Candidatus Agathobaculum intestinipullorum]|nr:hypothetical protein [Candidatus Agathobaculum intestinipullorum]